MQFPERPGHRPARCSDHGRQLVVVVVGYDLVGSLAGHHPLALDQIEDEAGTDERGLTVFVRHGNVLRLLEFLGYRQEE